MEKLGWHSLGTSFDCTCGVTHSLPIEACYVGVEAAEELALFAQSRCGARALVVSDENTRAAGGEAVLAALGMRHKEIVEKVYPGGPLEATGEEADLVAEAGKDCDFYVGIGSGTISDLAKSAGSAQNKPVLLFPTAASMNGYTSAIVALKVRGLKRTLPCQPATGIFANPEVVASAPQRMVAAGVADFLSKCSSAADWSVAHLLRGDYYCRRPREFNEGIQERLFAAAPAIGRGEPEAVQLALEALLLSGFGMVIAGSSAPASGGEHLISHYIDMKHALRHTSNDLHGVQVGLGTLYTLGLWEKVVAVDPATLDPEALAAAQPTEDQVRARVFDDWGPAVGEEVWEQWLQKQRTPKQIAAEIAQFKTQHATITDAVRLDVQPVSVVARCIAECGGPITPEGMTAPKAEFENGLRLARYLRNRFTILDLAAELGLGPA